MQTDNQKQLEQMRQTVDEKLQKTLEERIGQSFKHVSERLEQVYKGLGEMQTLAIGVGDLKKVLSGVKTRGILGEIQLGAILEQILSSQQYECNVVTKKGSNNPVEYAVKLPGGDEGAVYLPIDAKFPVDAYSTLLEAYDTADAARVLTATKNLERTIKTFAKSIRDKYIDPPNTTDFAVMFLPFEGLYAEVVRIGLVETLQRDYHINIAGPTTMAAILNSLQMGFRTLAIQKHSSEVWNVLGAVKTEFEKFGGVLDITKKQLETAHARLEDLVGVRTRQIQRKLRTVGTASRIAKPTVVGTVGMGCRRRRRGGERVSGFGYDLVGKIGSMALVRKEDNDIDYNIIARLSSELRPGMIWVSSGATEIGRLDYIKRNSKELCGNIDEVKTDYAAQGQSILMENYRRFIHPSYSVRQVLVEHLHFNDPEKREHLRRFLIRAKDQKAIPIVNYNDPVSFAENRRMELMQIQSRTDGPVVECIDNDETAAVITSIVRSTYVG